MVKLLCQLLIPIVLLSSPAAHYLSELQSVEWRRAPEEIAQISYVESLEEIQNPGMGFYTPVYIKYLISGNELTAPDNPLVHLRLDISEFSGSCNKKGDMELTQDMLDTLEGTLKFLEWNHSTAIIRFSYDPLFQGRQTYEPSMDMILRHQEQIGEVLSRHTEVVTSVECGLFGKWGEMHSSKRCTQENFNLAIDKWLEVLPDSIPISVRTPGQYCEWLGIDRSTLSENITTPKDKASRVGIYNDGYLANASDWGTYENREEEIAWLSHQGRHTVFGGEIGTISNRETVQPTVEYMSVEGFQTHTTYLNGGWHDSVINAMKRDRYLGEEERYQGVSGYDYILNRMGYRFVVRRVAVTKEVPEGDIFILLTDIENVGFANLVKPKDLELIFTDGEETYTKRVSQLLEEEGEFAENADSREWNSRELAKVHVVLRLPEDMPVGEYQIYLRLCACQESKGSELYDYPIRFANEGENFWNEELSANFLGSFSVRESIKSDTE